MLLGAYASTIQATSTLQEFDGVPATTYILIDGASDVLTLAANTASYITSYINVSITGNLGIMQCASYEESLDVTLAVSGGSCGSIELGSVRYSTISIVSGIVSDLRTGSSESLVTQTGGTVFNVSLGYGTQYNLTGGICAGGHVYRLNLAGGTVTGALSCEGLQLYSGFIEEADVSGGGGSILSGGVVNKLAVSEDASVNITGATVSTVYADSYSLSRTTFTSGYLGEFIVDEPPTNYNMPVLTLIGGTIGTISNILTYDLRVANPNLYIEGLTFSGAGPYSSYASLTLEAGTIGSVTDHTNSIDTSLYVSGGFVGSIDSTKSLGMTGGHVATVRLSQGGYDPSISGGTIDTFLTTSQMGGGTLRVSGTAVIGELTLNNEDFSFTGVSLNVSGGVVHKVLSDYDLPVTEGLARPKITISGGTVGITQLLKEQIDAGYIEFTYTGGTVVYLNE